MMYIYYDDGDTEQWVIAAPQASVDTTTRVDKLEAAMSELYQDAVSANSFEDLRAAMITALVDFA